MTSTKAQPGAFDALEKARDDEPIFTLLGRDFAAPAAITEWARVRRNKAIANMPGDSEELVEELRQCADAEIVALQMGSYRLGTDGDDEPRATRVAHSGVMGESLEVREHARLTTEAVEHLRNATFHLAEAEQLLEKLNVPQAVRLDTAFCLQQVKDIDDAVSPKRSGTQVDLELPKPIQPSFANEITQEQFDANFGCEYDSSTGRAHDWQKTDNWLIDKCSKCGEERA